MNKLRGFAALTPERRREISSKGGKRAHVLKHAHEWTPITAATAGRIGGKAEHSRRGNQKEPV